MKWYDTRLANIMICVMLYGTASLLIGFEFAVIVALGTILGNIIYEFQQLREKKQ